MLENFSRQALKIMENAKNICQKLNNQIVGTEHLLLAMYQTNDTICHFLLNERLVTYDDLLNELNKLIILRKNTEEDKINLTNKLEELLEKAERLSERLKTNYVYDEHLFYVLVTDESNVGRTILENAGLDIDELINDIEDIYNFEEESKEHPYAFLTNLSLCQKPHPYIPRGNHVNRLLTILKKKQKNNPLLIGSAGVGKTAVVEGLAGCLKDEIIYRLDLGGVMAGTKYRGELEEKIIQAMDFIKKEKAILFIDEIHNIVGAGSNDGSLDIANILKPYLARSDIRCIGATTLDEYFLFIEKDKALLRRFQNVFIDEPNHEETKNILMKIKKNYEEYHGLIFEEDDVDYMIKVTNKYLPARTFPDKTIDLMDEVGAYHQLFAQELDLRKMIDQTIFNMSGLSVIDDTKLFTLELNYPKLLPYYQNFMDSDQTLNNICVINTSKQFNLSLFKTDLKQIFTFKDEEYLEIDLESYHEPSTLSGLIGTSKGYIGYETGGILSEHIIKYPVCVVCFKNFSKAHWVVQNYLKKVFTTPFFLDNKSRRINTQNTIFLVDGELGKQKTLGIVKEREKITESSTINLCQVKI